MPVSTTRSQLLRKRLVGFTDSIHDVELEDARALRRARVASRRLRELIPVLQLESGTARKLGRRLRKVTRRLGTYRDLDALRLLIDELHVSRSSSSAALGRVGMTVSKARDEMGKRRQARLPVAEMSRLARKLVRVASDLRETEVASSKTAARSWRWAIEARVARRASRLSAAMADAGALYLPARLHAVRIAVKKLRYAIELAADAAGGRPGADLRALTRGQDLLGRIRDRQVLIACVRQTQTSLTPPTVAIWRDIDALISSLEDDCRRLHARYMGMRIALGEAAARYSEPPALPTSRAHTRRTG